MRLRICILFILLLLSVLIKAQVITTFAGNGVAGNFGDGSVATAAGINFPISGTFDGNGNYYFATSDIGCSVRKVSPDGIIYIVAGGSCGYSGDSGIATLAKLNSPQGIAVDRLGNIYIADNANNRVRKVDINTGIITTIAGIGTLGFSGDNDLATLAELSDPLDVCFDKFGNLYIADADNFRVRKINNLGIISTFAGNGMLGINGEGGQAINASLMPCALCSDKYGNIYIADNDSGETRVLRVDTLGIIVRMAGNPIHYSYNGDNIPAINAYISPVKITMDDDGNLFIADMFNCRIREVDNSGIIHTLAGNGVAGYDGDSSIATSSQINYPAGIAVDSCDNLFIADSRNYRVRKVTYPKCNYVFSDNILSKPNISIYPNPTFDMLNIDNINTEMTYHLTNLVGSSLQQGRLNKERNTISIQSLPTGMYILELIDNEGVKTVSKILKQ